MNSFRLIGLLTKASKPAALMALRSVGVPYDGSQIDGARTDAATQGRQIAQNLRDEGVTGVEPQSEIVALVAYLQRLGKSHEDAPHGGAGQASLTP